MNDTSRRKFLAAAAAGAGAVAGTAVMPITRAGAATHRGPAKEPVVAWIENPNADELVLMSGDREVVVRDRDLVSRILLATGAE